jgi:hypothetical protein
MTDDSETDQARLAVRGADYVESFVSLIRDRALRPLLVGARLLVLGLVGLAVALAVAVVVVIALVRLFTTDVFGGRVWATDLLFGGIFVASGTLLISLGVKRRGGTDRD